MIPHKFDFNSHFQGGDRELLRFLKMESDQKAR